MSIQIDVFGSFVCRDMARYLEKNVYNVERSIGSIPITSLYEPVMKYDEEKIKKLPISSYEKQMLKIQLKRNVVQFLKSSPARILVMDLAEEAMKRWILSDIDLAGIAVPEECEDHIEQLVSDIENREEAGLIEPETLDLEWEEEKYEQFAKDIVQSKDNPRGYPAKNIVVIESYFTDRIVNNKDGVLREQNKKYKVKQINERLKKLYGILYKYIPECQIIRLPIFTYATETNLRGMHPLSYTEDTYQYLAKVFNVMCGNLKVNTVDNIYKEQCLHNKLYTRVLRSNSIYTMKEEIKELQQQVKELQETIKRIGR